MISRLFAMLVALATTLPGRVMAALGIGWLSYASIITVIQQIESYITNSYYGISSDVLGLLDMAGFSDAIGIVIAGLTTRASLLGISKLGKIV